MLRSALVFFILALLAVIFGATNFAGFTMESGRILLFVFLALTAISLLTELAVGDSKSSFH